jgi:hypothetical protein
MKRILFGCIIILIFSNCEEVVQLDLPERDPRLVVEGLVTNEDTPYYVKLTHTTKYTFEYQPGTFEYEEGAIVVISSNTGLVDTLLERSPGIYRTDDPDFRGLPGCQYRLDIFTLDGNHYQSHWEEMLSVPYIDSIYFSRDMEDRSPDNPDYYLYNIYIDWQEPAGIENYYLRNMAYFWSGEWHNNVLWNWVFNDKYIDGISFEGDLIHQAHGGVNWLLKVSQFSLTRDAYRFWRLVHEQTVLSENDLSNSAVPLFGNVYNVETPDEYTLGYFQVSAVSNAEIYVDR